MKVFRSTAILLCLILLLGTIPALGADPADIQKLVDETAAYQLSTVSFEHGSEWAVMALARGGCAVPEGSFDRYWKDVKDYVAQHEGKFRKYTEYARLTMAITAIGRDPQDVGGYNLLAKLNQRNPAVRDYICDVIRFWVSEFDVDGIRLDAADVLDFDFMKQLRSLADEVKEDFWLMGEVIHGDYSRWANARTLHSVTNYALHKGLYSGHNDHNYFEIAHTVKRQLEMCPASLRLYNFVDNHDVERIMSKLHNKAHYTPLHILLYTLPGIPSVYYGSEFGIEGKKTWGTDAPLRPALDLKDYKDAYETNPCTQLIAALGKIHAEVKELSYGDYRQLYLTTGQYAFARESVIVAVNNASEPVSFEAEAEDGVYTGALSGRQLKASDGRLRVELEGCSGEIFVKEGRTFEPLSIKVEDTAEKEEKKLPNVSAAQRAGKSFEEMSVEELQTEILERMAQRGPVTEQMKNDVVNNIWHDSLVNWVKSFR